MPLAGPNNSASNISDGTVGLSLWSSPGNVVSLNAARATTFAGAGDSNYTTFYLRCQSFGFAIPSGSTVNGILLEINRFGVSEPRDNEIRLLNITGGAMGDNKASSDMWPSVSGSTYKQYGGLYDTWGTTWTPADINSTSFGARIQLIRNVTTKTSRVMQIDHIRMTVNYSLDLYKLDNNSPVYTNNLTINNGADIINIPSYGNTESIENINYANRFKNQFSRSRPRD